MKRISPTNDLLFKKTFASEENKDILRGLIHDFFGFEPEEITLTNPYSIEAYKKLLSGAETTVLRETRTDVTAKLKRGAFTMEMQVKKVDYYDRRSLYYAADTFRETYNNQEGLPGADGQTVNLYQSLRPVCAMNVLEYTQFGGDDDAWREFTLYDKAHEAPLRDEEIGSELLRIGYFEMNKPNIQTPNQRYWKMYFKGEPLPPEAPDYIHRAETLTEYVNMNKEERDMVDAYEKARADRDAEYATAVRIGEARGAMRERRKYLRSAAIILHSSGRNWNVVSAAFPDLETKEKTTITAMADKYDQNLQTPDVPEEEDEGEER